MSESMRCLLAPRAVAVFGASRRRRMARTVVTNLRDAGFRGGIYPIHPTEASIDGIRCYRALAELPEAPDCAVIALSPENTLAAFREAAAAGVQAAVILGSGFAEAGGRGAEIQSEIARLARERGMAVCGPNCLGLVTPGPRATLTGYHVPADLAPGEVAAVLQSGSAFWALLHNTRGIRFNTIVSSGNEATLTAFDYLDAALDDPSTRLLVAFLESVRDADAFLRVAARARARRVPIVVLKVGRSDAGRASVVAHTGALAGSDAVFDGVCAQEGIIRVDTLDELYDVCELLLAGRLPAGDRVAAITDSGGEKTLILDWGERVGLRFPDLSPETRAALRQVLAPYVPVANPLDAWGSGDFDVIYPAALRALAADDGVDVVVLGTDMVRDTEEAALYGRAMLALRAETDKPIAVVTNQANGLDAEVVGRRRPRPGAR
ncbi:MAG: CoA-binding protein, partial [Thermomicrobiaceae bacterium]|nr:CoA-binding protein [Thermomicrobiaceae bacterium]